MWKGWSPSEDCLLPAAPAVPLQSASAWVPITLWHCEKQLRLLCMVMRHLSLGVCKQKLTHWPAGQEGNFLLGKVRLDELRSCSQFENAGLIPLGK